MIKVRDAVILGKEGAGIALVTVVRNMVPRMRAAAHG
jgi:hypothetical protein